MRVGEDVGIHAQGEACDALQPAGTRGKQRQLGLTFDVELENAGGEGEIDFRRSLADSGEDYAVGCSARR